VHRASAPVAVGLLGATALGFALGGSDAAVTAGVAFAVGAGGVVSLLLAADELGLAPTDAAPRRAIPVAALLFGLLAVPTYVRELAALLSLGLLVAALVGAGVLLGAVYGTRGGLWQGIVAGGAAGLGLVFVSIEQSFTATPELGGAVLISGVVAPLFCGVTVGVGGALGGLVALAVGLPTG
jgi:hypothetical protein